MWPPGVPWFLSLAQQGHQAQPGQKCARKHTSVYKSGWYTLLRRGGCRRWALWRGVPQCAQLWGARAPAIRSGLVRPGLPFCSLPCCRLSVLPKVIPASQKDHLPAPRPLALWQWPHLGPHPYPKAAVSQFGHPSQHLLSASFLAPLSASPPRWPRPPWPRRQVKKWGQLSLLNGRVSRARLRLASGLPGHSSGPRTGNQLAFQTCADPGGAA